MTKKKPKYCPMSFGVFSPHADDDTYICKRSNCAWWSPGYDECVLCTVARFLAQPDVRIKASG